MYGEMGIIFAADLIWVMSLLYTITKPDVFSFLLFVAFCGSFYLGGWLFYLGLRRILRGGVIVNGTVLILLGIGLFFLCRLSFMGWYHQVG